MPYNPYNPFNPYGQPYYGGYGYGQPSQPTPSPIPTQPQQPQQPQQQLNTYAFVNGIEGAKSFPMQPNQVVMLMDSDNPVAYMKQSNNMGQSTIKYFRLVETTEAELKGGASAAPSKPSESYVHKTDFESLVRRVEALEAPKKSEG